MCHYETNISVEKHICFDVFLSLSLPVAVPVPVPVPILSSENM